MSLPGPQSDYELGVEFLEAFGDAVDAHTELKELDDLTGFYDPTGQSERRHIEELREALIRLVKSIKEIR